MTNKKNGGRVGKVLDLDPDTIRNNIKIAMIKFWQKVSDAGKAKEA